MSVIALREDRLSGVNAGADLDGKDEVDAERQSPSVQKYTRIGPAVGSAARRNSEVDLARQLKAEANAALKYRTCSWQKTAALLFSEYICLAIMSFPYSYSILGLVPGLLLTIVQAAFVLYTSLIVWEFCIRHPETRDVCDIGQMLFWNSKTAWYITAAMFLLNTTFIQGLHVLVISRYLNTMSGHAICSVGFVAVGAVVSFVCSLPRTFKTLSKLATVSTLFTFISVILAAIFAGIEDHPAGYNPDPNHVNEDGVKMGGNPLVLIFPMVGTTLVSGMNAYLNIGYTFMGQITLPSFIAEMKNPYDFRKALWLVTGAETVVFSLVGAVVYAYTGTQYTTAPAFGSLGNELYKKISFSFMVPTLIFLGVLYASVSARFVFFRVFEDTPHKTNHTIIGWTSWIGILAATWTSAFVVAETIPFFADLLSLMSSIFDSSFGWIFWGVAYLRMRRAQYGPKFYKERGLVRGWGGLVLNLVILLMGIYSLIFGTYASVGSIIIDYNAGHVKGVFTCADNSI